MEALLVLLVVIAIVWVRVVANSRNTPAIKDGMIHWRKKTYPLQGATASVRQDRRGWRNQKAQAFLAIQGEGYAFTARFSGRGDAAVIKAERIAAQINAHRTGVAR